MWSSIACHSFKPFLFSLMVSKKNYVALNIFAYNCITVNEIERAKTVKFIWKVSVCKGWFTKTSLFSQLFVVMPMTSRCTVPIALLLCLTRNCHLNASSHTPDTHENWEVQTWLDTLSQRPASTLASMLKVTMFVWNGYKCSVIKDPVFILSSSWLYNK